MTDPARSLGMLALAAAALWWAYGLAVELFIAWYSGAEPAGSRLVAVAGLLAALALAAGAALAI